MQENQRFLFQSKEKSRFRVLFRDIFPSSSVFDRLDFRSRAAHALLERSSAQFTRVGNELHDVASQQAFFRTALDSGWTELWNAGRLGIIGTEGMEAVVNRLGNYLRSRRNPLLDRQRFHARSQRDGETIDQYYSALAQIDRACDFQDEHCNHRCGFGAQIWETRLRDRLICGLKDKELVRRILEKQFDNHQGLTLDQVLQFCAVHESSKETEISLELHEDQPPHAATSVAAMTKSTNKRGKSSSSKLSQGSPTKTCIYCGKSDHPRYCCNASGKRCWSCGKIGHFANVCRKQSLQSADVDSEDCFEASLTNARERDEPLSSVGHSYIHHMDLKEHLSQRLVGIQVDCDDAQRCLVQWLPDSGAEVDRL